LLANDPFSGWRSDVSHASMVESNLEYALTLKYVHKDAELCEAFLERAVAIAEKARGEVEAWKHRDPRELMLLDRAEAYARWIKTGALDGERVRKAYGYAMSDATGEPVYDDWDGDDYDPEGARVANAFLKEGALLAAARLALVAGDPALCDAALEHFNARGQSFHHQMRDALTLASVALVTPSAIHFDAARRPIAEVFNALRPVRPVKTAIDQFWGARLAAFELAVIQSRLDPPGIGTPALDRVYAAIMAE
jgi:hypothetical protein